jgi:hypothetical protein
VPDEDLERPSLVPRWFRFVVVALAIVGVFAIVNWVISIAFGIAKGVLLVVLVIAVVAVLRALSRRR